MRVGLLPKGYERLSCGGLEDLTAAYYGGKCDSDDIRNLLAGTRTWMYDELLNTFAQRKEQVRMPVETPEGDRLMFALYFTTPDADTIVMTFPDKRTKDSVRAYVKIRPRPAKIDDAEYEAFMGRILAACERQGRSIARLLEGTIRHYHEERG